MKKEKLLLLLTAVLAAVLSFVPNVGGGIFGALTLPFTALGWLLRTLSLSGGAGNVAAIALYALVCCIPLIFWRRSKRKGEDWLLVLLCGVLALVLYYMVNPNLRHSLLQNHVGDTVYASAVWSTIVTWGVLKLVRSGEERLERNIYRILRIFLLLCAASCLMEAFGTGLAGLRQGFERNSMDYGFGIVKEPTYLFLILDYLALAAEKGLTAVVLYKGSTLLEELEADPFSEECVRAAGEVSRWCRQSLVIISLTVLALNIGQLLMSGLLLNVYLTVNFPVMGMAVSFAMLAVTKLLVRGKELKDESDLFI